MQLRSFLVSICSVIILLAIYGSFTSPFVDFNGCRMAYMYPSYVKLHHFDNTHTRASLASKYGLYLYKEGGLQSSLIPDGGIPVLYIPGNSGSYRQGRSIGAELAKVFDQLKGNVDGGSAYGKGNAFDMFTADFDEDLTAFHGKTLLDQAEYVNDAIDFILSLYSPGTHPATKDIPLPKSVILIGHSMGGIVARTLVTLPNYTEGSVNTILTLSTPHAVPPATFDSDITKIYHLINKHWRDMFIKGKDSRDKGSDITLVSIAGGNLDTMVPSDYSAIDGLVPATNGLTTFTTTIPFVWTSIDHDAIVWCDQLRKVLAKVLFEIIDPGLSGKTKTVEERMRVFRSHLLTGLENGDASLYNLEKSYVQLTNLTSEIADSISRQEFTGPLSESVLLRASSGDLSRGLKTVSVISTLKPGKDSFEAYVCSKEFHCRKVTGFHPIPRSDDGLVHPSDTNIDNAFYFAQVELELIDNHLPTFLLVPSKSREISEPFVAAQISDKIAVKKSVSPSFFSLINGFNIDLIHNSFFSEYSFDSIRSSFWSYNLKMVSSCESEPELADNMFFTTFVRQWVPLPGESKFFVNLERNLNNDIKKEEHIIRIHGNAPFVSINKELKNNLNLQVWTPLHPICKGENVRYLTIRLDLFASLANLVMRYRTVLLVYPFIIILSITFIQLRSFYGTYAANNKRDLKNNNRASPTILFGVFPPFSYGLSYFIVNYLPKFMIAFPFINILCNIRIIRAVLHALQIPLSLYNNEIEDMFMGMEWNDLLLGSDELKVGFLIGPLLIFISTGLVGIIVFLFSSLIDILSFLVKKLCRNTQLQTGDVTILKTSQIVRISSLIIVTILYIPYQVTFLIMLLIHLITLIFTYKPTQRDAGSLSLLSFYNFSRSIFMLLLFALPVNLPVTIVWVHGLVTKSIVTFISHHNIIAILPVIILVECLASGIMIPSALTLSQSWKIKKIYQVLLLLIIVAGIHSLIYGIMHSFMVQHWCVILCAGFITLIFIDRKDVDRSKTKL